MKYTLPIWPHKTPEQGQMSRFMKNALVTNYSPYLNVSAQTGDAHWILYACVAVAVPNGHHFLYMHFLNIFLKFPTTQSVIHASGSYSIQKAPHHIFCEGYGSMYTAQSRAPLNKSEFQSFEGSLWRHEWPICSPGYQVLQTVLPF